MNLTVADTRDDQGRERFFPYQLEKHMFNYLTKDTNPDSKYLSQMAFYPLKKVRLSI